MANVFDYIKNYADIHGITRYKVITKVLNKTQINQTLYLSNCFAFFFKIFAEGEIRNWDNITKDFLEIKTPTDLWDLSPIVEVVDFGQIQKVETDFIFVSENSVNFSLSEGLSTSMFQSIKNLCIQYVLMIPLEYDNNERSNGGSGIRSGNQGGNGGGKSGNGKPAAGPGTGKGSGNDKIKLQIDY